MQQYTLINGTPASSIPVLDRGLLYGQGLFETIRVIDGHAPLWSLHMARLAKGIRVLGLHNGHDVDLIESHIESEFQQLVNQASSGSRDASVRITVTGGEGPRGYRPPANVVPTRIIQWFSRQFVRPEKVVVTLCSTRLMPTMFGGLKHCNRLEQIAAAAELAADVFEGLVADSQGNLVEATSANLVCVVNDQLVTPPVETCGVAGVMREWLLGHVAELAIAPVKLSALDQLQAAALVNSNYGVLPIHSVNLPDRTVTFRPHELMDRLNQVANKVFDIKERV